MFKYRDLQPTIPGNYYFNGLWLPGYTLKTYYKWFLQFLEQQQAADPAGTHATAAINSFGGTSLRSKLQLDLRNCNDDDIPISELDSGTVSQTDCKNRFLDGSDRAFQTILTSGSWTWRKFCLQAFEPLTCSPPLQKSLGPMILPKRFFWCHIKNSPDFLGGGNSKCRRSTYVSRV